MLVSFAPGSMIDFVARALADNLSAAIGQPVVVETKSGGGGETPNVLLAKPSLGVHTVKDLVAYARSKGGKISIGHSGPGTMGHLSSVRLASEAGLDLTSVSYRGNVPMMIDVLGGQIDAVFPAYNPATRRADHEGKRFRFGRRYLARDIGTRPYAG